MYPAYVRTNRIHSGLQPYEAHFRCLNFLAVLQTRYPGSADELEAALEEQGFPNQNGHLTPDQASIIGRLARRFDHEGDTFARDSAELALNASSLMLDDVTPMTMAQSIQADQEPRRMQELRSILHR